MKYIEDTDLEDISLFLTERELGSALLNGKIECYSCSSKVTSLSWEVSGTQSEKPVAKGRPTDGTGDAEVGKEFGTFKSAVFSVPTPIIPLMPTGEVNMSMKQWRPRGYSCELFTEKKVFRKRASSLGDLSEPSVKKLLFDLISTMNESFPDYDFEATSVDQFVEKDIFEAMRVANTHLAEFTELEPTFLERLWRSIDAVINLRRCEVFTYTPDNAEDPFSGNALWSFNYFFFNRDMNRICYLSVIASSKYRKSHDGDFGLTDTSFTENMNCSDDEAGNAEIDDDSADDDMGREHDDEEDAPEW